MARAALRIAPAKNAPFSFSSSAPAPRAPGVATQAFSTDQGVARQVQGPKARVAINGFGRIGRLVARIIQSRGDMVRFLFI